MSTIVHGPAGEATVSSASLYVVAAYVPRRESIVVGSLCAVCFERGWHAYVGSARRGRTARVARHQRADKPVRWHADYLFSRHAATLAWTFDVVPARHARSERPERQTQLAPRAKVAGPSKAAHRAESELPAECLLAAVLLGREPRARRGPSRFGASDCACAGHLLWFPDRASLTRAVAGPRRAPAIQRTRGRGETAVGPSDTSWVYWPEVAERSDAWPRPRSPRASAGSPPGCTPRKTATFCVASLSRPTARTWRRCEPA